MKTSIAAIFAVVMSAVAAAVACGHPFARDGAIISNTGSTNFAGYTIQVWSDGSSTAGRIPAALVQKFFSDAKAARGLQPAGPHCMKSASFGSATSVWYHGWTSADLECSGAGTLQALAADVHQIVSTLGVQGKPHHIPLLPNELRRLPVEATASPERSPAAS